VDYTLFFCNTDVSGLFIFQERKAVLKRHEGLGENAPVPPVQILNFYQLENIFIKKLVFLFLSKKT